MGRISGTIIQLLNLDSCCVTGSRMQYRPCLRREDYRELDVKSQDKEGYCMTVRPLSQRDYGFVIDRIGYANHFRAAVADILLGTLNDPNSYVHQDGGFRIGLVSTKVFDEYMSAMEDLGALIRAVKHKIPNGIMYEFINYPSRQIGDLFAEANGWGTVPSIADLLGITDNELTRLKTSYEEAGNDPDELIAYLDKIPTEVQKVAQTYLAGFDDEVIKNSVQPQKDRSMKSAHNKIKHGVGLIADAKNIVTNKETTAYGPAFQGKMIVLIQTPKADDTKEPLLTSLPVTPEIVTSLVTSVSSIKHISNAILHTVAVLIQSGIWNY